MRKAKPKKRLILPDPVFNDQKVSKFVNHLMYDGKKNASYTIFYNALDIVKEKAAKEEKSPLEIWKQALDNITPQVEVKSRRIGGATFQVPTEIRADRKESVAMKHMPSRANDVSALLIVGLVGGGILPPVLGLCTDGFGSQVAAIIFLISIWGYMFWLTRRVKSLGATK